jgi:hypothetical protein
LCENGYSVFWSQFPTPSTSSSLFTRSGRLEFWIFAYLKGMFQRNSFDTSDRLLSTIQKISMRVDRESLDAIFQEWMIRQQKCIDRDGEYVRWCLNWNVQFIFLNSISWDARLWRNTLEITQASTIVDRVSDKLLIRAFRKLFAF